MDRRGLCLRTEPGRRREACFKGTRFGADGRRGARECLRGSRTRVCLERDVLAGQMLALVPGRRWGVGGDRRLILHLVLLEQ